MKVVAIIWISFALVAYVAHLMKEKPKDRNRNSVLSWYIAAAILLGPGFASLVWAAGQ